LTHSSTAHNPQRITTLAISAKFLKTSGQLDVFGDAVDNTILVSRNAAGTILVNGGSVNVLGGTATVANTSLIEVFGQGGNDTITLDESSGALPAANLFGGAGNDTITGGSGADQLFGQSGNDTLFGKGGNDVLFGGDGNDVLNGGVGSDQLFGGDGNDKIIWNPGDGSDLAEGGAGNDTLEVNLGNGAENFTITANGTRVQLGRVSPAPFSIDAGTIENIIINANGGDDVITAGNGLSGINLTIDGGAGNDTITGGDGNDRLIGGDGNDLIIGGRGSDTAQLGAGNDVFVWNPGDGSDVVDGGADFDTLDFRGASINEKISISANGAHAVFTRDVAAITMDLNGVERIQFEAFGGADKIVVNDLTGTDVKEVAIDLAGVPGSGTGDGAADVVTVNGSNGNDVISLTNSENARVFINGLAAQVTIDGVDPTLDTLVVNGGAGNDTIDASGLSSNWINLTIDGGAGNDTIIGSGGNDTLIGGDGNDLVIWNPGDGSDVVDGGAGYDALDFRGADVSENISIAANGAHAVFSRDVAGITMDLNNVERIQFEAFGGADHITVNDLTGTAVKEVAIDLAATGGGGDGQADTVSVNGTAGDDHVGVVSNGASVVVNGLAAQVTISGAEGANDSLVLNALGGNDTIDASGLAAGQIQLTINAGDGNDTVIGSAGNDLLIGGRGNDVLQGGDGNDTFVWNPGDGSDVIDGQAGTDTLLFNGANVNENITISANGEHAVFFRDVAAVTVDLQNVETIDFNALGGTDTITINDMTGTAVSEINIDLAGTLGGTAGDGLNDTVVINATSGDDVITLSIDANGALVIDGLASQIVIEHFEPTDTIHINGLGGDDVIDASAIGVNGPNLVFDGGDGADILLGGAGNDTLIGGAGDDILLGGGGQNILDGGPGDNVLIQGVVQPVAPGAALINQDLHVV
jgi:Ca2+-binding RTX toxin-like protein